ncbi:MAG: hypothetical protein V5A72_02410 [Candidatus Nanohaloarchaea archaeon]
MLDKIFRLTPLGRADGQIRDFLEHRLDEHHFDRYNRSLNKYRNFLMIRNILRVLMYASLITSIAASFNLNLSIINQVVSYVGFSFIALLYLISSYLSMLYREEYHVQRDILISEATESYQPPEQE